MQCFMKEIDRVRKIRSSVSKIPESLSMKVLIYDILPLCLLTIKKTEHRKNKVFKSAENFNSLKPGNIIFVY